jgi:Flp pilus assembly protein TadD
MSFYANLVRTSPHYAGAHEGLGQAMDRLGFRDGAVAAYREALRLDPGRASAYNSLGALLANEEAFAEAARLFRQAVRLDPALSEARLNLGVACIVLRDRSCVSEQLDALRRADPEAALRLQSIAQEADQRERGGRQVR